MVFAGARPVALFEWSSARRHLGPRDCYLGWCLNKRRQNIRFLAYNTRYLIPPWVQGAALGLASACALSAHTTGLT